MAHGKDRKSAQPVLNITVVVSLVTAHAVNELLGDDLNVLVNIGVYLLVLLIPTIIKKVFFGDDAADARQRQMNNRVQRLPHSRFS